MFWMIEVASAMGRAGYVEVMEMGSILREIGLLYRGL